MKTAILIDNMYLQNLKNEYDIGSLDPSKYPTILLRPDEEHFMTYIFDAEPYMSENPTETQLEHRRKKREYFEAIQLYERVKLELGYVTSKHGKCPNCSEVFSIPVQKQVDVKIAVKIMSLAWERIVEKIVLLCGDGDILPAVRAIEPTGTIIRLVYGKVGRMYANRPLIKECPEKTLLTRELLEKMQFKAWE